MSVRELLSKRILLRRDLVAYCYGVAVPLVIALAAFIFERHGIPPPVIALIAGIAIHTAAGEMAPRKGVNFMSTHLLNSAFR